MPSSGIAFRRLGARMKRYVLASVSPSQGPLHELTGVTLGHIHGSCRASRERAA